MNIAVIGLGFGAEGKGTMVDYLCSTDDPRSFVVRHNGGPQALHNVVTEDGRHHGFSQFGSGTFRGIPTLLSRKTVVAPWGLWNEARHLRELGIEKPLKMVHISGEALLLTQFHRALRRYQETQNGHAHGTTGWGVGEAVRLSLANPDQALRVRDVFGSLPNWTSKLMTLIQELYAIDEDLAASIAARETPKSVQHRFRAMLAECDIVDHDSENNILAQDKLVFEGAQGVLLDEWYGFHPYTTWSTTTFKNVSSLLSEAGSVHATNRMGVVRSYFTRHGPGPFPSERPLARPEQHNVTSHWMGPFRVGDFDSMLVDYSLRVCGGVDILAVTHMDSSPNTVVDRYLWPLNQDWVPLNPCPPDSDLQQELSHHLEVATLDFQQELSHHLEVAAPVLATFTFTDWLQNFPEKALSFGPTKDSKISRSVALDELFKG